MTPVTLRGARKQVEEGAAVGIDCPCCDQRVMVYKRRISSGTVRRLAKLLKAHRKTKQPWVHHTKVDSRGGDFAKLRHWGLIKEMPNFSHEKRTSGFWKITPKGMDFLWNRVSVPTYVYIKNNKIMEWSKQKTNIKETMGKDFNYADLMKGWGG